MISVPALDGVAPELARSGYSVRQRAMMRDWLGPSSPGWSTFAASWDDLPEDRYMADGGRYRRRRYAVFDVVGGAISRAPHQPHFQARTYNRLNGDVARWFSPISDAIVENAVTRQIITDTAAIFGEAFRLQPPPQWHVELHQFRIEATQDFAGLPTPEGVHRDGVDGVVVLLIDRKNAASGVTELFDLHGSKIGDFTLAQPGDAVFIDDRRIFHGVTPITPLDPRQPSKRDVLVVTFRNGQV